jgi:hypothetical protein
LPLLAALLHYERLDNVEKKNKKNYKILDCTKKLQKIEEKKRTERKKIETNKEKTEMSGNIKKTIIEN